MALIFVQLKKLLVSPFLIGTMILVNAYKRNIVTSSARKDLLFIRNTTAPVWKRKLLIVIWITDKWDYATTSSVIVSLYGTNKYASVLVPFLKHVKKATGIVQHAVVSAKRCNVLNQNYATYMNFGTGIYASVRCK